MMVKKIKLRGIPKLEDANKAGIHINVVLY